jgi:hypothetical protein
VEVLFVILVREFYSESVMSLYIKALLTVTTIGASALDPNQVNGKFEDLGKDTQAVKARWAEWNKKKKPGLPRTKISKLPKHIKDRAHHSVPDGLTVIPVSHLGGCGQKMKLGVKKTPEAAKVWKLPGLTNLKPQSNYLSKSFLQAPEHPGRESFSVPGAGADQTLKDIGRDTTGTVAGTEPYVTVLKDGFFGQGCHHDTTFKSGDKFGDQSDEYKMGDVDVSIVLYDEIVLDEDKMPMTPTVCFEFCRTIPDMVYFGIANGKTCYCTPYFHPGPGYYPPRDSRGAHCDAPCPGDQTTMCGNMDGKSSVFEMHLCDDTQTDLTESMDGAKQALDYFMESVLLAKEIGDKMATSGQALETAASLSGAPGAAEMGRKAKAASKGLVQAFMSDTERYQKLFTAYKLGEDTDGKDFLKPANAASAEAAVHNMKANMGSVISMAVATHEQVKLAYPVVDSVSFGDAPDTGDAAAMKLQPLLDGAEQKLPDFRVASYAFDTTYAPAQSSCTGKVIGLPMMGLGQAGCALACEATVYPDSCVAYSFYMVTGGDDICFMLKEVDVVETFVGPEAALLQKGKTAKAEPAAAYCGMKMSHITTGAKPTGGWTKTSRSFGGGSGIALSQDVMEYSVPSDTSVTLGSVTLEKVL